MLNEKNFDEKEIEKIIRETDGSMSLKGMPLEEADKNRIRRRLRGEITPEEARAEILASIMEGA